MPRRMSNRERMEHLRAEADAAAKEKASRPRAATGGRAKPVARVRLVWSVCGPSGKEVARFPYAREDDARADAVARTEATGQTHFVTKAEAPVE